MRELSVGTSEVEAGGILVVGLGDRTCLDSGLGPALADEVRRLGLPGVATEVLHELTLGTAARVAGYQHLLFVIGEECTAAPFEFYRVEADRSNAFVAKPITAAAVLALASDLFRCEPEAFLLKIRGYEFNEYAETITPGGKRHLDLALTFVKEFLAETCGVRSRREHISHT